MSEKIKVEKPLVVLHGDEMAQVAFTEILARFVSLPLDIQLVEIDLSAPKRFHGLAGFDLEIVEYVEPDEQDGSEGSRIGGNA